MWRKSRRKEATHGERKDEHNAYKHGEEHPNGPKLRVEPIEEIRGNGCGNDHRRRKLVTADGISVIPGGRGEIGVKDNEEDDGRLQRQTSLGPHSRIRCTILDSPAQRLPT